MSRSYEKITETDLHRLSALAKVDRDDLFSRRPDTGLLYSGRLFAVALCQGAAMHYLDGKNGIKDLDIWSFYEEDPRRPFPYRRRAEVDFGLTKFGQTEGYENFVGRKVDLIGRSITNVDRRDPVGTLQRYLREGRTESARRLAEKAMVLIGPEKWFGQIVWPVGHANRAGSDSKQL